MKILLCFGDNDYGDTLLAFGNLLIERYRHDPSGFLRLCTPESITDIWNGVAPWLHVLSGGTGQFDRVESYLTITPDRVHVGEGAVEYMNEHQGQWNHSWLYAELGGTWGSRAVLV